MIELPRAAILMQGPAVHGDFGLPPGCHTRIALTVAPGSEDGPRQ